jgi:hypothetical protein
LIYAYASSARWWTTRMNLSIQVRGWNEWEAELGE